MRPLKILVVEDDPLIAEDLRGYLIEFGHHVIGPASSMAGAQRLVKRETPDVAILDIHLGGAGLDEELADEGCRLAEWINQEHPMPFIYLTSHSDETTLARASATRPGGYILKPFSGMDIKVAVEIAFNNHLARGVELSMTLDPGILERSLSDPLSEQEIRVLEQVAQGATNKEIGQRLFISENTVKTHLKNIFLKLEVRNRTEAIRKASDLSRGQITH